MSRFIDPLIFDRVQADVDQMTKKAYIAYDDLNRVEMRCGRYRKPLTTWDTGIRL